MVIVQNLQILKVNRLSFIFKDHEQSLVLNFKVRSLFVSTLNPSQMFGV